jgi:ferritin-like metal-binding protein YciE
MYYGKLYLEEQMPSLVNTASFNALKMALTEMQQDVNNQISQMAEMYTLINEIPNDIRNNSIKSIVKDEFCLVTASEMPVVNDMNIILYVQILEHINITAYRSMKMTAPALNNKKIE